MDEDRLSAIDLGDEVSLEEEVRSVEAATLLRSSSATTYRLCYELGAGGMATIYLARSEGPGGFSKLVAIKRLHPHLARRKDLVEMFLDEARIASMIAHPNVCTVHDFGMADGSYYLAMEHLVGEPLNVVIRRAVRAQRLGTSGWHRVLGKVIAGCAEGLHAAHELLDERGQPLGIVHRDVSPQNLFVTYLGVAKVMDFGVAYARDRITQTVTGGIKGKLGYFAPEQLARKPFDRRLDVWALGIVLWEGLTGRRLFEGRSEVDTLLAVQTRVIPPPSRLVPSVPAELDAIALRALERDPDARYPTARAMARDLLAYLKSSGGLPDDLEIGELVRELCADRAETRAEVVASAIENRPRTATAHSLARSAPEEATVLRPLPVVAVAHVANVIAPAQVSRPEPVLRDRIARASWIIVGIAVVVAVGMLLGPLWRAEPPAPTAAHSPGPSELAREGAGVDASVSVGLPAHPKENRLGHAVRP